MGTAREPVVGSGDLAGVDGKRGKLLRLRFGHDDLLQSRIGYWLGGVGTGA